MATKSPGVRLNSITEMLFAKGYQQPVPPKPAPESNIFLDNNDNIGTDQSIVCCECGSVIRNVANIAVHMRRHLDYKPHSCSRCSYSGYDEEDVRRHANRAHVGGPAAVVNLRPDAEMEALVSSMTNKSRVVEQKNETPSPPQLTASPKKASLIKRLLTTTADKGAADQPSDFICGLCNGLLEPDAKAVIQHLKSHMNFGPWPVCPCCSCTLSNWTDVAEHIEHTHKSDISSLQEVLRRLGSVFGEAMASLADEAFKNAQVKPRLPCALCAHQVPFCSAALDEHLGTHNAVLPLKCSLCPESFSGVGALRTHFEAAHPDRFLSFTLNPELLTKLEDIPFERAYPILSVQALESLHSDAPTLNGASGDRSPSALSGSSEDQRFTITCQLCSARISRNDSCLIAHAKVHLAYKPLKCELCNFRHFAMSKIRRHYARVHVGKAVKVSYHPVNDIGRQVKEMKQVCFGHEPNIGLRSEVANGAEEDDNLADDAVSPLPVASGSPTPSDEALQSPVMSPASNNAPAVSKLLEQLIKNNPLPPQAALAGDQMTSPNSKMDMLARDDMTSPDMGTPSGRSSYETYDLSGMGKKVCGMCNTFIANNPSSFENHACKHLDYKPYHCHYCAYQSYIRGKVTRHIQQVHSGLPVKISHKPLPGIKEKIHQMKIRCFPFLTGECADQRGLGCGGSKTEEVECTVCQATVVALECAMDEHLQIHIPVKYYHCPVCTYQTTFLIRAKQHVHSAHPTSQETRILCCPPEGIKGLQTLRVKCFGVSAWARYNNGHPSIDTRRGNELSGSDDGLMDTYVSDEVPLPVSRGDEDDEEDVTVELVRAAESSRISCSVCKALVSNQPATVSSHVRNHLTNYKPYQCSYCEWNSSVESDVKQHILNAHKSVPLKVVYNPERDELIRMQERCFPNLRAQTGRSITPLMVADAPMLASGATLLKKLSCGICKNTIADNPKSIGIHVKNHLNYKPYRCPFCKYMSCEQSKARRHVEHVHNVSGETVEIHAEENIKDRIADMKARCFPSLVGESDGLDENGVYMNDENNDLMTDFKCQICSEFISAQVVDAHVRTHLGKPFKCAHCTSRFWTEDKVLVHLQTVHVGMNQKFVDQHAIMDAQFETIRSKCFPELSTQSDIKEAKKEEPNDEDMDISESYGSNIRSSARRAAEGKLICRVCENQVSVNPNSIEVHAKTHLNFKQHQCGYCNYRSCISGKVKRHLDNVHRGQDISLLSFSTLPLAIKQIIAEMRSACFPQLEGDQITRSAAQLSRWVDDLKRRIIEELQNLDTTNLEPQEVAAATAATNAAIAAAPASVRGELSSSASLSMVSSDNMAAGGETDLDSNSNRDDCETPGGDSLFGKLQCMLCSCLVADNPSSLGLHVRNHLDYKPFSCNLCDYKSCIQAKVKRHLRNVHKCATDEMTYSPEPDIRLKVMDMKVRCFPKIAEAAELAMQSHSSSYSNFDQISIAANIDSILNTKFDAGLLNSCTVLDDSFGEPNALLKCSMCEEEVSERLKIEHLTKHGQESRWHCSECDYNSFSETQVKEHADDVHPSSCAQPIRFDGTDIPLTEDDVQKLEELCFGDRCVPSPSVTPLGEDGDEDDEDDMDVDSEISSVSDKSKQAKNRHNNLDGPRYICQLCGQAVSMYASSLYVHVKNHMNYKPYCCAHCDYRSPVKSKVRRHIQNAHRKQPMTINYFPTPGIEHEVLRMKKKCFPDVTSFATLTNDKIPCLLCKTDVADTPLSKSVHAKNHLDSKPFHCGYCSYRSCLKGETRRHVTRQHTGKPVRILFREDETVVREAVDQMITQCFQSDLDPSALQNPSPAPELTVDQAKSAVSSVQPETGRVKLGPAYREWYCPYCSFSDTSKYHIKEHCLSDHPGKQVHVSGLKRH